MRTTHWVDGVQQPRGDAQAFWRTLLGEEVTPEQILQAVANTEGSSVGLSDEILRYHLGPFVDRRFPGVESAIFDIVRDARDRKRYACACCGAHIGDSPASDDPAAWPDRNPPVDDDAAWARIVAAHRPGCEWAATRAHCITRASSCFAGKNEPQPRADDYEVAQTPESYRIGRVRAILAADLGQSADLRRFDRGLMSEDEQRERILDAALAPLARWDRFTRLLRGDVPHGSPCRIPLIAPHTDGECTFEEIPKPSLTAAEFAALEGIEAALARKDDDPLPWAIAIAPFALVATCTACGATRTRAGIAVTVRVGDWTLERRYAAEVPPGWRQEG